MMKRIKKGIKISKIYEKNKKKEKLSLHSRGKSFGQGF
jgi:hypothetical protein